jgi:hypothetical protein
MKRFSEQLHKKAQSIRLKATEKRDLRDRLVSYMEYHPLPNNLKQQASETISIEQSVKVLHVKGLRLLQWSGVMVAIFTLVIPYAAERAVPGDTLYAVKVHLNEEVRSTLARSSYEKIVWETELLNRRIAEARLLANEGRLTEETETMVADAVRTHSENARKEIETLKQTDKEEAVLASIQLDTALDVQSTSLKNTDHASTTEGRSTTKIAVVLEESQSDEVTEDIDLPSYERLMGQVEIEGTRAHELLNNIQNLATAEEQDDIKRRLEDIERKIAVAMTVLEASDIDTRKQLVVVLQQTQRLIVFMTNIDVREAVTVDEIVPVTLTSDERLAIIKTQIQEAVQLNELIDEALVATSTGEIIEKVELANIKSKQLLGEVISMLEVLDLELELEKVEAMALEAYELAKDSWNILDIKDTPETDDVAEVTDSSTSEVIEEVSASTTESVEIDETKDEVETEIPDSEEGPEIDMDTDTVPESEIPEVTTDDVAVEVVEVKTETEQN